MNKYDCVVVGCGPCGITTAIYLKRYGYTPLVIGKDYGPLSSVNKIENYYGFSSISGKELIERGIAQAKSLGIEVVMDEVLEINSMVDDFEILCKNEKYVSKTIMLATGIHRNKIPALSKFEGSGVSYCATCDGFFYRKKKVALLGSGAYMLHELDVLKKIVSDITIFTNGEELETPIDEKVIKEKIISFNGENRLESITTTKDTYPMDGCFIATGSASSFTIAKHIGLGLKEQYVLVDENYMTTVQGIYAGGDAIGGLLQISKAVSDGAKAATAIQEKLKK